MSEFNGFLFNELHKLKWLDENVDDGIELQKKAPALYDTLKNSTHSMEIIKDNTSLIHFKSDQTTRLGNHLYLPVELNIMMLKNNKHWCKLFRFVNVTNHLEKKESDITSFPDLMIYMNKYRKHIAYFGDDHIVYIHLHRPESDDPNNKTKYAYHLTILYPSEIKDQIDLLQYPIQSEIKDQLDLLKQPIREEFAHLFGDKLIFIYCMEYERPSDQGDIYTIHAPKFELWN